VRINKNHHYSSERDENLNDLKKKRRNKKEENS
jgi:hypothetical protein